jgi:hypothetical protein
MSLDFDEEAGDRYVAKDAALEHGLLIVLYADYPTSVVVYDKEGETCYGSMPAIADEKTLVQFARAVYHNRERTYEIAYEAGLSNGEQFLQHKLREALGL